MLMMMMMTTRMNLACLLVVSVVLVFDAADASFVTKVHLAPTPNPSVASRPAFNYLTRVASPPGTNPEAPSPSARLKYDDFKIGIGSMNMDGIRCCRKMLLEAHVEGDEIADNVSQYFGGLKDYLTGKFSR